MDLYDAYTLYQDISAAYFESRSMVLAEDEFLAQNKELQLLMDSRVSIADLPEIIPVFYWGIGAGGKLSELTKEEVPDFEAFFEQHFPGGANSLEFDQFTFDYAVIYEDQKSSIGTNILLLKSIKDFHKK